MGRRVRPVRDVLLERNLDREEHEDEDCGDQDDGNSDQAPAHLVLLAHAPVHPDGV